MRLLPEAGGTRVELVHSGFRRVVDRSDHGLGWPPSGTSLEPGTARVQDPV